MPPAGSPYDTAGSILNAAEFRLNGKLKLLFRTSGMVLDETNASTHQAFNNAFRRFQDKLGDAGVKRFKADTVIHGIPPTKNTDPASRCSISWFQFFDGTNFQTKPLLPSNLILPLWMSERPANTNFLFPDVNRPNMRCMVDGLQSRPKYQFNGQWEWAEDTIRFPGAIQANDFRIGYRSYLPDIVDVGQTRWWNQPVQVMRCQDPLAWWFCAEFAAARSADGDATEQMVAVASACVEEAEAATKLYCNRDVMLDQRTTERRRPYGGGRRGGWGWGSGGAV